MPMETQEGIRDSGYRIYKNEEAGFSFEVPFNCREVMFSEQKIPTASGSGLLKSYITENSEKAFMLGITDLGVILDRESSLQVMDYARSNVVKVSTVIASGNIEFLDLPALTLRVSRVENKVKTYMDILFCINKDKQYQLEVVTISESGLSEPDALHFFESFRFI
ncbi:MAG: hypothetical protein JXB88_12650 [Spirochaetales bacterium]|nr:hypothetical protein [Spirochaetales bacterium]